MVHLDAFPGTVRYDAEGGLEKICEHAAQDYNALCEGGVSGVIFCNENDKPYTMHAGPEIAATMTAVVNYVLNQAPKKIPFGIDIQWDPKAALAVAKATGAAFIRGIVCGTFCGDLGFFTPNPLEIAAYRKQIGAEHIKILTNLAPEFSCTLDTRDICVRAQTAVKSSPVDGLCVSGVMAGGDAPFEQLQRVKAAVANMDIPVFANTGVKPENAKDILAIADGCVTATCLKVEMISTNRIDVNNVRAFMDRLN
ncbi:MAG: BtpA/SgcQ family protein [Oscillospiraceae bacterium]|nr:BtpA/SgcQ family protein [Oscillospiraceae bacterium]